MNIVDVLRFIVQHPLNQGQRARAIGRFFRWQIASRLLPFPVALPFVNDLQLLVVRGMTGATGNYYCGLHEPDDMAFVLHFLRPGDSFYDIGANVGSYTLLAAATGVTTIVSFEPSAATSARLERNIVFNGLSGVVTVHRVALGEQTGEVRFSQEHDTTNHVLAEGEYCSQAEIVAVRRFDDFYSSGRPSFIKMDVEGFESQVLAGATAALNDPALLGLLVEDNGSDKRYGRESSIAQTLHSCGFAAFKYDPSKRTLRPTDAADPPRGNILFLRDLDQAAMRVAAAPRFRLVNGEI